MPKSTRHALIREILKKGPIPSQQSLLDELATRGIHANQATISRDFRAIGLVKTAAGYVLPGQSATAARAATVLHLEHVYAVATAQNLIVLKTPPGLASRTAIQIDQAEHPDLVGTVAGDDTVFIATRSSSVAKSIAAQLENGGIS